MFSFKRFSLLVPLFHCLIMKVTNCRYIIVFFMVVLGCGQGKTTESVPCAITGPSAHASQAYSTSSVPIV